MSIETSGGGEIHVILALLRPPYEDSEDNRLSFASLIPPSPPKIDQPEIMKVTLPDNRCESCSVRRAFGTVLPSLSAILLIAGCTSGGGDADVVPPVPVAEASAADAAPSENADPDGSKHRHYTGIGFAIPNSWQEVPNVKMIDSKYIIPTENGDMEMTLTSMGGGAEGNISRWVGQVGRDPGEEPSRSTVEVAGIESYKVDVRGSYNSTVGDNPGPREDWRLIGIVVPQQRDFTIKLAGPREAVVEFQDELQAFLKTAHLDH